MITNILLTKGYERGYLPKSDSAMIQPVFATANLAVRKKALDEVGLFDINCKTGEDVDLSIRLSKTKWELFFEPRAIIRHKHRTTLIELFKQWYGYGKYHPYIFKKHTLKCMKLYYSKGKDAGWSAVQLSSIFGLPFPMYILVFVRPFHIFNLFFILALLAIAIKSMWLLVVALGGVMVVWLCCSGRQFFKNVVLKRDLRWIVFSVLRYILNWAYVSGAFFAGLKVGMIYLDATREETPSTKI